MSISYKPLTAPGSGGSCSMLPEMPNAALGWNAFGLSGLAARGEVRADPAEVQRVLSAIRDRL